MSDGQTYVFSANVSVSTDYQPVTTTYDIFSAYVFTTDEKLDVNGYSSKMIAKVLKAKNAPRIAVPERKEDFLEWLRAV